MERGTSDKNILDEFAVQFATVVERHCEYIIVSGFVAISSGRMRATEDIDMILPKLSFEKFHELHRDLIKYGFVCMQSDDPKEIYDSYLTCNTNVRYTWKNRPIPEMEVKFAKDEVDDYQFKTKEKIPLTGLDLWFSSINMNIAFKEGCLKSDKDLEDARHLRIVYREKVDEQEIKRIKDMLLRVRR
ncbi:hypothetical protein HY772_03205 [Candidatus Woesearchaeota archaeon]|nr:hypothetical protein [Candidatus Woesearchaeota archaeon]